MKESEVSFKLSMYTEMQFQSKKHMNRTFFLRE